MQAPPDAWNFVSGQPTDGAVPCQGLRAPGRPPRGARRDAGTLAHIVGQADVVILSVPMKAVLPEKLFAGARDDLIVVDIGNQGAAFGWIRDLGSVWLNGDAPLCRTRRQSSGSYCSFALS
jgi:hypothetical protein